MAVNYTHFFLNGIEYYISNHKYYKDNGTCRQVITLKEYMNVYRIQL